MHIDKDFQREYSVHRAPVCDFSLDILLTRITEGRHAGSVPCMLSSHIAGVAAY